VKRNIRSEEVRRVRRGEIRGRLEGGMRGREYKYEWNDSDRGGVVGD
jgi:hypothetical protein